MKKCIHDYLIKNNKCPYCKTKKEKKVRIEPLYKEPFLLVKQKSSLEKYRLLFMELSLKINEIINWVNSHK